MPSRTKWSAAAAAALVLFALSFTIDHATERWVTAHRTTALTTFFRAATHLGDPATAFVIGLVLAALAAFRSLRLAVLILVVTLARPLVSTLVKDVTARSRPALSPLVQAAGDSFPSGHTLAATVAWGCLPAVLIAWRIGRDVVRPVALLVVLIVVAVAASRVYLGVHWVSDVLGGALLGMLLLGVVYAGARRN